MSKALRLRGQQLFRGVAGDAGDVDRRTAVAPAAHAFAQTPPGDASADDGPAVIPLIARLCEELRGERVRYCHWKSNWRLERWLKGDGDLDLLVEPADARRFESVLARLGFRLALPTSDRQVLGVLDYYGFDAESRQLVHLHVHHRLVLGHDLTKNFHLPIERAYLESSVERGPVPVPAPEFEFVVFVFRMVLKHVPGEAALRKLLGKHAASSEVRKELDFLETRTARGAARELLRQHLPFIDADFFDACVRSLRDGRGRFHLRLGLERRLRAHARRSQGRDVLTKLWRRASRTVRERVLKQSSRKRLASGGRVIALVGGDGSGKTTAVNALHCWLSKKFVAKRFHLGKPPRSPLTLVVIVLLRARRALVGGHGAASREACALVGGARAFPGYLQLLRWVCAARDRQRLYARARRFATGGGLVICDRFPVERLRLMDGPNIARAVAPARMNRVVRLMLRAEASCYERIMPPDLLFVLRVDPEVAVRRKTTEGETHVRTRARELWEQDWADTRAHVIDAGRPSEEVVARLQSIVWAEL